jgi:hypothetical protein
MEEMRNVYKIFVGNPEEKRQFLKPSRKWENRSKINLKM